MDLQENYLSSILYEFNRYKALGDKTFSQLTDEDIHWKFTDTDNCIAVIVKHMAGNMLSRFTNFLIEDGEKPWRQREAEFENTYATKKEMITAWEKGWKCVFDALASVNTQNFDNAVKIRNVDHSIPEAFNRQLGHYATHVGQIVMLGKMIKGADWISLSIPPGGTAAFNKRMFGE